MATVLTRDYLVDLTLRKLPTSTSFFNPTVYNQFHTEHVTNLLANEIPTRLERGFPVNKGIISGINSAQFLRDGTQNFLQDGDKFDLTGFAPPVTFATLLASGSIGVFGGSFDLAAEFEEQMDKRYQYLEWYYQDDPGGVIYEYTVPADAWDWVSWELTITYDPFATSPVVDVLTGSMSGRIPVGYPSSFSHDSDAQAVTWVTVNI